MTILKKNVHKRARGKVKLQQHNYILPIIIKNNMILIIASNCILSYGQFIHNPTTIEGKMLGKSLEAKMF